VKVAELTAFHVRIPLRRPIGHASHKRTETDNLLVRCVLEDKSEGFGEGVPREYVTGETIDSAMGLLGQSDLRSQLEPCRDFAHALKVVEGVTLASIRGDERGCRGNAARCAVELALLDAYGRSFGQPLSRIAQILTPELYQPRERVRYSGAITSAKGLKLRLAGWVMRLYRFHQVKVKVGIAGYDDASRLHRLRRCLGPGVDLRVDANEAWSPAEVVWRIQELEPFGITAVEQPVPHKHINVLGAVRREVHVPIMHDESLCSRFDAECAVEQGTCDLFNLRLSKCGGFIPTLRLAQLARRHGLGYQLGCQVGETAVLSGAGRHFAASVADLRYVEGSYDRHLVRESLSKEDLTFRRGGWAPALTGPGLGVTLDPEAIQRVTLRKESLVG
jgi:muconate cycloisomerase